jgi:very-short-patch-repair endonuclease
MREIDRIIHTAAAPQHGVVSRSQLRSLGVGSKPVGRRIASGSLEPLTREVLVVAGSAPTDQRRSIAAVLDVPGRTALSHRSAAAIWRLPGFSLEPLEVVTERVGRDVTSSLATVHTTTKLPYAHLTVVDGLVVTVPVRVLFDVAGRVHPLHLERSMDTAWRMRLVTGRLLRRTLAELAEHGRPGIQLMRELIEQRGDDYRPTDSNVEARFERIMAAVGITTLRRQVDVGGMDWIGRVDFVDDDLPLAVEIDSDTFHLSLTDRASDSDRRRALEDAGHVVVSVRDFDVWHDPRKVQQQVLAARRRAKASNLSGPGVESGHAS